MDAFGGKDVPLPVDPEDEDFAVYPENWKAVQLFLKLGTQWRVGPMGGFFGLDYSAVDSVMNLCRVRKKRKVFEQIRIMEVAALSILNKKESAPHLNARKPAVR